MGSRTPSDMDCLVGQRIRHARRIAKMSQSQLGKAVGVTYQQIQKYENGTDRVGAGRLYAIAKQTDQPVEFFFREAAPTIQGKVQEDILSDPYMQKLLIAVGLIKNQTYIANLASIADTFATNEMTD